MRTGSKTLVFNVLLFDPGSGFSIPVFNIFYCRISVFETISAKAIAHFRSHCYARPRAFSHPRKISNSNNRNRRKCQLRDADNETTHSTTLRQLRRIDTVLPVAVIPFKLPAVSTLGPTFQKSTSMNVGFVLRSLTQSAPLVPSAPVVFVFREFVKSISETSGMEIPKASAVFAK